MDYMKFLNASLSLKAEGLENGYRALADFNGVVWQGRETLLGAQFITWGPGTMMVRGSSTNYYMEDYRSAKEDFALRASLIARERLFDQE